MFDKAKYSPPTDRSTPITPEPYKIVIAYHMTLALSTKPLVSSSKRGRRLIKVTLQVKVGSVPQGEKRNSYVEQQLDIKLLQ